MKKMMEDIIIIEKGSDTMEERISLAAERIREFPEPLKDRQLCSYFSCLRDFILLCEKERKELRRDRTVNEALYRDMRPENYPQSWLDPAFAAAGAGAAGQLFAVWYAECLTLIPSLYEKKLEDYAAVLETTVQIFNIFEQDDVADKAAAVKDVIYEYVYDYAAQFAGDYLESTHDPSGRFALDIVMNADLSDTGDHSYLYSYGEWITDEQLETARLLDSLPEDTIDAMARIYTDGYIRGFALTGKDIRKKSSVICYLPLGFERFMRRAVGLFEEAGLKCIISRHPVHLINARMSGNVKPGFYGASNPAFVFDHSEDSAVFWGSRMKAAKLDALRSRASEIREMLGAVSGHACVEIFGENVPALIRKPEAPQWNEHQLEVKASYVREQHDLMDMYVPDEETSYTIIAWPVIAAAESHAAQSGRTLREAYREVFEEIVRINTLPTDRWEAIQQKLIDALDKADHVEVKGSGSNQTDLTVRLHTLSDPSSETNFENCLADVNIPAGEVFTSPVLKGTEGLLHVGHVYIGGYLFRDLKIRFRDGRVCEYECANYEEPEEGRRLIRNVIFQNREELPVGEFAIGTNTTAFTAARRFRMEEKMPVLIAEKTGPHFAVGDTCYSYEEDIVTVNPDGKKIIARENECSALRHTMPEKAYFHVHTDITLPYDELGRITACCGTDRTDLIRDGRFVLEGTEELNEALDILP